MKTDRRSQILRDPLGQNSGGLNTLRSPCISAGEAALKGLGESPSQSEKALEDRSNPLDMSKNFSSLCRGLSVLKYFVRWRVAFIYRLVWL
jgi:hypothetical protein